VAGIPSAKDVANLFLHHIFRLHGLPLSITSDRGSLTSHFWKKFLELLNIKCYYSTAHHHQSNGQVERLNGVVTQTAADNPKLWTYYLPMVEFSINNTVNSSTKKSPFEIVYGHKLNFDPDISLTHATNHAEFTTMDWSTHFNQIRNNINSSKLLYKENSDKNRAEGPAFKIGDYVWVNQIPSLKKLKKFAPRRIGPFKIIEILTPVTFKLELPPKSKSSNIVHIERLEKFS